MKYIQIVWSLFFDRNIRQHRRPFSIVLFMCIFNLMYLKQGRSLQFPHYSSLFNLMHYISLLTIRSVELS